MVSARKSIMDFDRKFDRFVGEDKQRLRLIDKLAVINESQLIYFENTVELAEVNSKVRENLRVFEKKEVSLKLLEEGSQFNIYEIPEDNYRILRLRVIVSKVGCPLKKELQVIMFQTDDLNNARKSPFWKSSFEWEHALADEGSRGMYVWHEGDFNIEELIIDYYRKPEEIHAPSMKTSKSYTDWNGIVRTEDQNTEFNEFAHRKIIDLAILKGRADLGDVPDFQLKYNEILNLEKINN